MPSTRRPLESTRPIRTHLPLAQAQVCLDCEEVFAGEGLPCPSCTSKTSWPLLRWLEGRPRRWAPRSRV